jgi:hypothetical protein
MRFHESSVGEFLRTRRGGVLAVVVLLTIQAGLLGYAATRHSPTELEPAFLASGVSHWRLGRFELYRVNPPLPRMIAAIPAVLAGCKEDWTHFSDSPGSRSEFHVAEDFVRVNGTQFFPLLVYGRWACIAIYLIGGFFAYRWANELYGQGAGLVTLTIWTLEPNLLAHAELITSDSACWSFGLAAIYLFWRWLKVPSWRVAVLAGLFLGVAELSKLTWIILFALFPALWLFWRLTSRPVPIGGRQDEVCVDHPRFSQLIAILLLAIYVINVGYGFDKSGQRLDRFVFVSTAFTGNEAAGVQGNRWQDSILARLPVPVPRDYLLGLDAQTKDLESYPLPSYLNGKWKHGGWWYFYLFGLLIKVPLGIWALFLAVVIAKCVSRARTGLFRSECILIVPALTVLLLTSAQLEFNLHLRYVFPAVALGAVFLGQSARPELIGAITYRRTLLALTLGSAMFSLVTIYPHQLAYFNELAGGPRNGHKYLLGSSLDWGQDLLLTVPLLDRDCALVTRESVAADTILLNPMGFQRRRNSEPIQDLPSKILIAASALSDAPELLSLYSSPAAVPHAPACYTVMSIAVADIPAGKIDRLQWRRQSSGFEPP